MEQTESPFGQEPMFENGKERRRRARDLQTSCSSFDKSSSSNQSPLESAAASSIARAGVIMVTEDFDRLSGIARKAS